MLYTTNTVNFVLFISDLILYKPQQEEKEEENNIRTKDREAVFKIYLPW
jgi:hypothetical protein